MKTPIVIIGAGINSLVAAADLAARGRKVIVLEQAESAGGAVGSRAYTLPGFQHDLGAMNFSTFVGSPFYAKHGAELQRHGLQFLQAPRPFAQALTPGDHIGISTSLEETLATFHHEQDKQTWQTQLGAFPATAGLLGKLLNTSATPAALAAFGFHALRKAGISGTLDLLQLLVSSPRAWLERTFTDPRLRTALSSWGMHLDFAPDIAGGAMFPYLEGFGGQLQGMMMPQGGAGQVSEALVAMIVRHGGQVRCGERVTAIRHAQGVVLGVDTEHAHYAASTVLANLAPKHLADLTGATPDPAFDAGMRAFRHAPGTLMLHLALDRPAPWLAPALQGYAYVHIARTVDTAAQTYTQALAGLLPAEPVLVVGQPTVVDPSRAPAGKHILWVQMRMVPASIHGDAKHEITTQDWAQAKEHMADRAVQLIEAQAPGLRDAILARHVVSPLDLAQANPNLVGGDQVCGSHHLSQNFLFRPVKGFADGKTPIKGLHLIGAATWPGAGTGAGSGFMKAQAL